MSFEYDTTENVPNAEILKNVQKTVFIVKVADVITVLVFSFLLLSDFIF
jgi:hypothetical protein